MLARHPLTGKPIRILNCETSLWKDAATLVWLEKETDATPSWSKYTVGVSSIEDLIAVSAKGIIPEIVIALGDVGAAAKWLRGDTGNWRTAAVIAVPKALLEEIGLETVRAMGITNMLCLEELHLIYPHVGSAWDGTADDARILIAGILRYSRTGPISALGEETRRLGSLQILPTIEPPASLIFLTQYYRPDKASRRKEIDACLVKNLADSLIDRVVLLNEAEDLLGPDPKNPKLTAKSIGRRLNFADVLRWIYEEAPKGSIVVFANSDIYLDPSWKALWSVSMKDVFLSLLRWDDGRDGEPPKLFGPRADSQDTWVVAADSVKSRTWNWDTVDIPFGKGGCDNAINIEMLRQKFLVANPALSLITHHLHLSGYRTYNPHDIVDRPFYMYIHPTGLHDFKPETQLPPPLVTISEPAHLLELRGAATKSQERTFATMAAKVHKGILVNANTTPVVEIPIYSAKNLFVNHAGLVSTYDSILLGSTAAAKAAWSALEMSKATPSIAVQTAIVAPLPDAFVKTAGTFVHRYLGKILAMRTATGRQGDFLAPNEPHIVDALRSFQWAEKQVPVVRRDPAATVYASQALFWQPQDAAAAWTTAAEVAALRNALRVGWRGTPGSAITILMDGTWVTHELVRMIEREFPDDVVEVITPQTPLSEAVSALVGSRAFVYMCAESAWNLLWALPRRAKAVELQFEMAPTLESLHMAQVCSVDHHCIVKARATAPSAQDAADFMKKVVAALGGSAAVSPIASPSNSPNVPTLYMPAADTKGFFAHAGDSFREIARIWERNGYVKIEFREGLSNVWLGSIGSGGTLLYDRPTMEWLNKSSAAEREWLLALFGNPKPLAAPGSFAWTFWPRRPELVEELVSSGYADTPLVERARRIVFYGRSENSVQADRRSTDWASTFTDRDEFIHVKGLKPYPLTQREYLERLADARFGLCLAGYGYKCHREIECMAMGCVPVVAPEVDMESYAVPPVEGIHYLRCRRPEDLPALLSSIDTAKWTQMSVAAHTWWRNNASAAGAWALTKRLAGL